MPLAARRCNVKIDPKQIEEAARALYIRALKLLPPDIKSGFRRLDAAETDATHHREACQRGATDAL